MCKRTFYALSSGRIFVMPSFWNVTMLLVCGAIDTAALRALGRSASLLSAPSILELLHSHDVVNHPAASMAVLFAAIAEPAQAEISS